MNTSTGSCGRAITCTATTSPTRPAAVCAASHAARTAATSPRTMMVVYPPPVFSYETSSTRAAFTAASAASTTAANERVSIIPSASVIEILQFGGRGEELGVREQPPSPPSPKPYPLFSCLAFATTNAFDCLLGRAIADVNVALFAAEVDAAEAAERADLEDVDVRGFLRLVRGDRGVAGGRALHHVQRLSRDDHVAVARPVDELCVVIRHVADHLAGGDLRLDALAFLEIERVEDRRARLPHVGLGVGVQLEHAVQALDDHHARPHVGRFERDVGDAHDVHAGGDFDEERCLSGNGEKSLGDRPEKRGELRLEAVDEDVAA